MLGDGDDWYLIKAANPGIDPERLMVGQVLKLPAKNGTTPTPQPKPVAARSHRVGEGDTLTSIASDYYGDSQRWGDIFEANRAALGGNPNRLRVDVVLVIP
jgi:nucleoid-associated protein YgaU